MAPETLRDFYEHEADFYRVTPEAEPAWKHRRDLVARLLPKDPGPRILDAGCADGALTRELARWTKGAVVGADLAVKRVAFAASHGNDARFLQGSLYEMPFQDESFSLVLCSDVLEHLDAPELAMRELVRVSSRYVLVTVPYQIRIEKTLCPHCNRDYFLYGHQHSFGKSGIEALAAEAGARVVRFEHLIPMFECRRYKYLPFLKWLIWDHFKNSGTLGALIEKEPLATRTLAPRTRAAEAGAATPALRQHTGPARG